MPAKQHLVRVNDVDLNVVDTEGSGLALVFLHYWGGSSRTWLPVMEYLANTHRCIAIDFRGWGQSSRNASSVTAPATTAYFRPSGWTEGKRHLTVVVSGPSGRSSSCSARR